MMVFTTSYHAQDPFDPGGRRCNLKVRNAYKRNLILVDISSIDVIIRNKEKR
jgi:hypothetical protein